MKGRRPKTTQTEWIGGIIPLPIVIEEPKMANPELIVWLNADGFIVGQEMHAPGEAKLAACTSLNNTIKSPMVKTPQRPTCIRVASKSLADMLKAGFPNMDIVCAPTPEVDDVAQSLLGHFQEDAEPTLFMDDVTPAQMAWVFSCAAEFYRKKPWKALSLEESVFTLSIPTLGLHDVVLVVSGCTGGDFGLIIFDNLKDYDDYLDSNYDANPMATLPEHMMLCFETKGKYPPSMVEEVAAHELEIARSRAYPFAVHVTEAGEFAAPYPDELIAIAACAHVLAQIKPHQKTPQHALENNTMFSTTFLVPTPNGSIEVKLSVPEVKDSSDEGDDGVWRRLSEHGPRNRLDYDERMVLERRLMDLFLASPEAEGIDEVMHAPIIMDIAKNYFGRTLATLPASDLREVIFELVPAKVMMPASEAEELITEMRAIYAFLGRRFGFIGAQACLTVLGRKAVKTLEKALSSPELMGIGKSMLMEGLNAGFDMQSEDDIRAWMALQMIAPPTSPEPKKTARKKPKKR